MNKDPIGSDHIGRRKEFVVPMMRIERMTSPLPRECSTTEPHGQDLERVKGIEPSSGAWKASALPLSYTRSEARVFAPYRCLQGIASSASFAGGGGWIRTIVGVSQQIYSLPPLATRAPLRSERTELLRLFIQVSRGTLEMGRFFRCQKAISFEKSS